MSYSSIVGLGSPVKYKLYYFDARGRAETVRLLFALAGQPYDDIRLGREEWMKLKPKAPFGQMPLLEVDGVMLSQSRTIARFVARRLALYGNNDLEQFKVDMVVDCTEDMLEAFVKVMFEQDKDKKAELEKRYFDEQLPHFVGSLEKMIGPNGVFVGKKLTLADISLYIALAWPVMMGMDISAALKNNPKIKTLYEKVEKNPKIAEWLKKRRKTQF